MLERLVTSYAKCGHIIKILNLNVKYHIHGAPDIIFDKLELHGERYNTVVY